MIQLALSTILRIGGRSAVTSSTEVNAMSPLHEVNCPTLKATFAMGCFWGPDSLFGATNGVIRTRVGYTGGTKANPTYKNLGDHTEAIDIDFDPALITFPELLNLFWLNHDPTAKCTTQYSSFIFYHTPEQQKQAEEYLKSKRSSKGDKPILTVIKPSSTFYNAEAYHQKYRLQQHPDLMEFLGLTNKTEPLINSHVAARLNGYVVGFGGIKQYEEEWEKLGLNQQTQDKVRKLVIKYEGSGITC